jgi:hypothetical protein
MKLLTQFIQVDLCLTKVISIPLSHQLLLARPLRQLILFTLEEAISSLKQQRAIIMKHSISEAL